MDAALAGHILAVSCDSTVATANGSEPTHTYRNLYLWLSCSDTGVAAVEVSATGTLGVLGFTPLNGVMNIGTPTDLLLAVPGCPTVGTLGYWTVLDNGGTLCLGVSPSGQGPTAIDCHPITPTASEPEVRGFSSDENAGCTVSGVGCIGGPSRSGCDPSYHKYEARREDTGGQRLIGVSGRIEREYTPHAMCGVSAWVTLANQTYDEDNASSDFRFLQVGWRAVDADNWEVYVDKKLGPVTVASGPLITPPPVNGLYKIELDANEVFKFSVNGMALNQDVPLSDPGLKGVKFCSAQFAAETHSELDYVPGTTANHCVFSCCKVREDKQDWRSVSFNRETSDTVDGQMSPVTFEPCSGGDSDPSFSVWTTHWDP